MIRLTIASAPKWREREGGKRRGKKKNFQSEPSGLSLRSFFPFFKFLLYLTRQDSLRFGIHDHDDVARTPLSNKLLEKKVDAVGTSSAENRDGAVDEARLSETMFADTATKS